MTSTMYVRRTIICLCLLGMVPGPSEQKASFARLLRLAGKSADVADFALTLNDFFGFGSSSGSGSSEITSEALVKQIDTSMAVSQASVLSSLLETSKLDRIYDAVIAIHSSMLDMKNLVKSDGKPNAETFKQHFIQNYLSSQITKHLRFLPELLTYIIPGYDIPLLEQLKQSTECNHTALGIFRDFYVNLLSDGIGLQVAYTEFTSNITLDTVLETEWESSLVKVQNGFDGIEVRCFDELYKLAHGKQPCFVSGSWSKAASWVIVGLFVAVSRIGIYF